MYREPTPHEIVETVAAGASDPMLVLDAGARIAFANPAAATLIGIPQEDLRERHAERFLGGITELVATVAGRRFAPPLDSDEPGWPGPELRLAGAEGPPVPVGARIATIAAQGTQYVCVAIRRRTAAALAGGRALAEQALEPIVGAGAGGVIVLDVDHFELVNQSLGRAGGDHVLADLGLVLQSAARPGEVSTRLEADRFAVVTRESDVLGRGEQLLEEIRTRRFEVDSTTVRVTASAGAHRVDPDGGLDAEQALLAAEDAVRAARAQGRDRCVLETAPARRKARLGVGWNDKIRTGIESGGLTPHFQPILDLNSGRISHFELLARLRGDDGSLIQPSVFIPIAERLGMVGAIDRWAIRTAVKTLSRWAPNPAGPRIAVNASGRSVGAAQLLGCLHTELKRNQVFASKLIIEVTETSAIGSIEEGTAFGQELRSLGVGFALDDFGAGFGTFLYLKHLPLDLVKIDGEFIRGISRSPSDQLFVRSIVEMAHGRQIRTVAEYVTDQDALDCVRSLGIDYAQGFHIGRPQPLLS